VSAYSFDACANSSGACACVKIPEARWVQCQRKASLKLKVKLGKCNYSAEDLPNPSLAH
jgi:hypothetical protein